VGSSSTIQRNGIDARVSEEFPAKNFAEAKQLWVSNATGAQSLAFLYFNRSFPRGATIMSATLRLYTKGAWNTTPTITLRRVSEPWKVKRLTYNNMPTVFPAEISKSQSSAADEDEWAFDVSTMLQNVADSGGWFGVRIATNSTTPKAFYSSNAVGDRRPTLEVTWSRAPQEPTELSPSGDRSISIAKPILRCDFTDHMGSTQMQAIHVQIDPEANWGSPSFDSGVVAATEPELDLATTSYPGLGPAGNPTRWRVRVQDGAGLWSPWSDPAWFRRDVKGTLNINNPAAAPNDFVAEWTPPITWTLTGETQKAWQVFVTPDDDRTDVLHDTGRTRGTDNSHTLPSGVIEDDERYRVHVRVWDAKDREHTPGDPPWTHAEQSFVFREDATVNPVTQLAAENLLPRPWVELTWQRSTAPDRFVVKRDGRVIDDDVDPADSNVGDTNYRFVDKEAKPYRHHTWAVQSVVNRKTSGNNPSVGLQTTQQGIWLHEPERDIDVFIQGKDDAQLTMGEEATTHYPLGSKHGVRITQSLRGFEGTVTGRLAAAFGYGVEQWENNLLSIKERPGRVCVLSMANESIRCVVHNITTAPTPTVPITKAVSFEFFEVGRLSFKARL
jgi:hypothetical protein